MMRLLISAAIAAVLPAAAFAVDYYVDNRSGSDKNDGRSPERAFATIGKATSRLRAGDTMNLAPGKYYESIHVRSSGTPEKPIVINGNGAVLCGLTRFEESGWKHQGGDLYFFADKSAWGALRPKVYMGEEKLISAGNRPPEDLKPLEASWQKEGVYFRAEKGRKPSSYDLMASRPKGFTLHSGVFMVSQSYVIFKDITAERFANDGFNVHLSCHGIVFRNITGRHCGDDGFSVHEDVQSSVFNGHFFDNNYGIQDVNASQTEFFGCTIESNRVCGVDMYGGMRNLRDCKVRHNRGAQIRISTNKAAHMNMADNNPMLNTLAYLGGVSVGPGEGAGISVGRNTRVCAMNCDFAGVDVGVAVANGGVMHLVSSRIGECRKAALKDGSNGGFLANKSKIWPEQNGEKK
jgi:hypothetical protein